MIYVAASPLSPFVRCGGQAEWAGEYAKPPPSRRHWISVVASPLRLTSHLRRWRRASARSMSCWMRRRTPSSIASSLRKPMTVSRSVSNASRASCSKSREYKRRMLSPCAVSLLSARMRSAYSERRRSTLSGRAWFEEPSYSTRASAASFAFSRARRSSLSAT